MCPVPTVVEPAAGAGDGVGGRTLIVGSTGFIGRFVAEASLASGRPTYLLVRPVVACPFKAKTIKSLQDKGALLITVLTLTHSLSLYFFYVYCISLFIVLTIGEYDVF